MYPYLLRAVFISLLTTIGISAQIYPPDTLYSPVFTDTPPLPAWHESIRDSSVPGEIVIFRLSRYNAEWDWYPVHDYAKIQPWNADASLIKFASALLYDARTGNIIRNLPGDLWESRWSHTDPDLLYSVRPDGTVKKFFLHNDSTSVILHVNGYESLRLGPGEGNFSADDQRVSVIGKNGNDMDVLSLDMQGGRILATRPFAGAWQNGSVPAYVDWVSVSPSGQYTLIMWNTRLTSAENPFNGHYGVEVYRTEDLAFLRRIAAYGNHGDFAFTPEGEEIFVQFYGPSGTLHAYFLDRDSLLTLHTHPDFGYGDAHVSGQNYLRPGWVYLSTDPEKGGMTVAVKTDGSQTVELFGHHFTSAANYAKSPMPVPSPDGSRVMFRSDFGRSDNPDEVYAFIAHAEAQTAVNEISQKQPASAYPNPFEDQLFLKAPCSVADVVIFTPEGKKIFGSRLSFPASLSTENWKKGMFFVRLNCEKDMYILKQWKK